ncbi:MAG: histidine kinase [Bacteroidales bacterium]|jgi:sensor histidine kinase YesM|nr:histidine kinase [Bacteroidales bacterium]
MIKNPILQSAGSRLLYLLIWTIITCIDVIILSTKIDLPIEYALLETLVFNILFAFCILPLWYPVRFSGWEHQTWLFNLTAHFALVCIYLAVCLLTGYLIVLSVASDRQYADHLCSFVWIKISRGALTYLITLLIYYLYVYLNQLKEKTSNEIRLNNLLKDGELNLLKSQINPHFLFNSLNSVSSLIVTHPEKAQQMLVALSEYLRYAVLSTHRVYSRIEEEMENIHRYLSIEKLRFGDKLVYNAMIAPEALKATVPAMLLQPLFENAVKHGIYESLETVCITITVSCEGQDLRIVISNDYDGHPSVQKGSGTGLQNVRERLRLLYDTAANMHVKMENGKFTVTLDIKRKEMASLPSSPDRQP